MLWSAGVGWVERWTEDRWNDEAVDGIRRRSLELLLESADDDVEGR